MIPFWYKEALGRWLLSAPSAFGGLNFWNESARKSSYSPRKVLFLYGSAFSWVYSKERFRERSYSVKSSSSPRKALCKVLVKSSFSMGALSLKRALSGALSWTHMERFRSAFRGLSERFRDSRERLRERFRERFTRTKLLKCKRSKVPESARKRSERFLIYRTSHRPIIIIKLHQTTSIYQMIKKIVIIQIIF